PPHRSPPFPYTTLFRSFQQRAGIALRPLLPQTPHPGGEALAYLQTPAAGHLLQLEGPALAALPQHLQRGAQRGRVRPLVVIEQLDRKSTRLNSSHVKIS